MAACACFGDPQAGLELADVAFPAAQGRSQIAGFDTHLVNLGVKLAIFQQEATRFSGQRFLMQLKGDGFFALLRQGLFGLGVVCGVERAGHVLLRPDFAGAERHCCAQPLLGEPDDAAVNCRGNQENQEDSRQKA